MKHFLIFLLLLLALSARAEIPLELVAEFELPVNAVAWDVQHWMDDSTFGWAAVRNDTVFYVERLGEDMQTFVVPADLFDTLNWRSPSFETIHSMRLSSYNSAPIVALTAYIRDDAGTGEYEIWQTLHVFDLEQGVLIDSVVNYAGYFWFIDGWNWSQRSLSLRSWPPPPACATMILNQRVVHSDFEGPGTDHDVERFATYRFTISNDSLVQDRFGGQYDIYPNTLGDLVLNDSERDVLSDGGEGVWGEVTLRYFDAETGLLDSLFFCNTPCLHWQPCASQTVHSGRLSAIREVVFSVPEFLAIDTLTFAAAFSLAVEPGQPALFWNVTNGRFIAATPFSQSIDFTDSLDVAFEKVVKTYDGDGVIAALQRVDGQFNNHVVLLDPCSPPFNLTCIMQNDESAVRLSWTRVVGAASYHICRSLFAEGDFCEQDVISVADTFYTLPIVQGVNREFFRVKAIFD